MYSSPPDSAPCAIAARVSSGQRLLRWWVDPGQAAWGCRGPHVAHGLGGERPAAQRAERLAPPEPSLTAAASRVSTSATPHPHPTGTSVQPLSWLSRWVRTRRAQSLGAPGGERRQGAAAIGERVALFAAPRRPPDRAQRLQRPLIVKQPLPELSAGRGAAAEGGAGGGGAADVAGGEAGEPTRWPPPRRRP